MKQKLAYIFLILMAIVFVYLRFSQEYRERKNPVVEQKISIPKMRIGSTEIVVEIADTPQKRIQGLSGRDPLPDKNGMLFPMGVESKHSFWMKDMKFDLDILWIKDNVVVDITENVKAPVGDEIPVAVQPREPVTEVLEAPAGLVEKYGLNIGDGAVMLTD